jgi:hypothetical protein
MLYNYNRIKYIQTFTPFYIFNNLSVINCLIQIIDIFIKYILNSINEINLSEYTVSKIFDIIYESTNDVIYYETSNLNYTIKYNIRED